MAFGLDLFTGKPAMEAAAANRAQLTSAQGTIGNLTDITRRFNEDALRTGYGGARQDLATGYGASTGAINTGAGQAINYLDQGNTGALGRLDAAKGVLGADGGAFRSLGDLSQKFGAGAALYGDALGINGPEGNARAQAAFTAGPGYQWQLGQGLDAVNRGANAAGRLASGNTDVDLLKYGQGLASQNYQQWLGNLSPYNQLTLSATQGAAAGDQTNRQAIAGLDQAAAGVINAGGAAKAGVAQGQGNSLADIAQRHFTGQAGLDTGEGTALAGNMSNTSNMYANSLLNLQPQIGKTYNDEAQAELTGQKNLVNLGMQLATLAAGGAGGAAGGGGMLGSIGNSFNNWLRPIGSASGSAIY